MLDVLLSGVCLATLGGHLGSAALAARRCRARNEAMPAPHGAPRVVLIRPVCGVDTYDALTLASTFSLDYPDLKILFCCDREHDPATALVRSLIAAHPNADATLLIGRDPLTANPKLNNILKAWPQVDGDWVLVADSNVLMPCDYVQRVLMSWAPDTGVLSSPPIGDRPADFWGEVECAFLNTYQARWQYAADSAGLGFAQGKTLLFRRADLAQAGGLVALGAEVAEDAAATKLVRGLGLAARLVDRPFRQPLGPRTAKQVWDRQARWARLRRITFPLVFAPEILTTSLLPIACAAALAESAELPIALGPLLVATLWYGAEAWLARAAGWHYARNSLAAAMLRDALLPALWVQAWLISSFHWRGNEISAEERPASHTP